MRDRHVHFKSENCHPNLLPSLLQLAQGSDVPDLIAATNWLFFSFFNVYSLAYVGTVFSPARILGWYIIKCSVFSSYFINITFKFLPLFFPFFYSFLFIRAKVNITTDEQKIFFFINKYKIYVYAFLLNHIKIKWLIKLNSHKL